MTSIKKRHASGKGNRRRVAPPVRLQSRKIRVSTVIQRPLNYGAPSSTPKEKAPTLRPAQHQSLPIRPSNPDNAPPVLSSAQSYSLPIRPPKSATAPPVLPPALDQHTAVSTHLPAPNPCPICSSRHPVTAMKFPAIVQSGYGNGSYGTLSASSTAAEFIGTTCSSRPLLNLRLHEQQAGTRLEGELSFPPAKLARCKVILFSTGSTDAEDAAISAELRRVIEAMGLDEQDAFNANRSISDDGEHKSEKRSEKVACILIHRFRYPPPDVYPFYDPLPAWSWKTQDNDPAMPNELPSFTKGSEAERIKTLCETEDKIIVWISYSMADGRFDEAMQDYAIKVRNRSRM